MNLPYQLNHEEKTIALTRKFAKESSVPGSDEYILLMKLKTDFPTYDITMGDPVKGTPENLFMTS